jgi:hypothetical protein
LTHLAERTGLPLSSPELFERASARGSPILEPPIIDSIMLFDGPNFGGNYALLLGAPLPDLSWVGFDDRANSLPCHGICACFRDVNFGGPELVFLGAAVEPNLNRFAFGAPGSRPGAIRLVTWNNQISSLIGCPL